MKIGGNLPLIGPAGNEPKKSATSFPDVAKTPTPAGPVPVPYPNVGDTFERAGQRPLSALLGRPETKAWGDPHVPGAQQELAVAAGKLFAEGDVAGGSAAWTDAMQHDPGIAISELLPHLVTGLADGLGPAGDVNALVQHVLRESSVQASQDLRSLADQVKALNETKKEIRGALQELREGGGADELDQLRLQIFTERRQKAIETMSAIVKKLEDARDEIVRNLGG